MRPKSGPSVKLGPVNNLDTLGGFAATQAAK